MVGIGTGNSMERFLPLDIIINILKRLPVKTLTRFKCVAIDWLKLIQSPNFITQHHSHSSKNNTFLLLQGIYSPVQGNYSPPFLIGSDLNILSSQFMNFTGDIIGSCNGLWCFESTELFLCNPATRQVKQVPQTLIDIDVCDSCRVGFGFSHVNDYKIVRISVCDDDGGKTERNWYEAKVNRAEVYSLTTGSWKEINVVHLQNLFLTSRSVTANGAIFWDATMITNPESGPICKFVSFDIAQEVFNVLKGPPQSQSPPFGSYCDSISVHNDKFAVFRQFNMGCYESCFDLWVLEDTCAVGENWIKKYNRVGPYPRFFIPRFFLGDEIVCSDLRLKGGRMKYFLTLINPCSCELRNLPVDGSFYHYGLFNYAESLIPVGNIHRDL